MSNGIRVHIRYSRSTFKEAMQTEQVFCCIGMAEKAIRKEYLYARQIEIKWQCWDKRINSDSFIITVNDNTVGYLWYKLEEK